VLKSVFRVTMITAHKLVVDPLECLAGVPDWCDPVADLVNDLWSLLESITTCCDYSASERMEIEVFSAAFIRTVNAHPERDSLLDTHRVLRAPGTGRACVVLRGGSVRAVPQLQCPARRSAARATLTRYRRSYSGSSRLNEHGRVRLLRSSERRSARCVAPPAQRAEIRSLADAPWPHPSGRERGQRATLGRECWAAVRSRAPLGIGQAGRGSRVSVRSVGSARGCHRWTAEVDA
jgi:hypothetical protein